MNDWRKLNRKELIAGQSLVETALFLPILVFMLVGIVEVANLLNTQSKLTTASRMAASYGAANVTEPDVENWGDPTSSAAFEMGQIALNTIGESLDTDSTLWDVYSVYFEADVTKIEDTGTFTATYNVFTHTHAFGDGSVLSDGEWTTAVGDLQEEIKQEILTWPVDKKNDRVIGVASVPYHNIDTILGLPLWQWLGMREVQGLTVMRLAELGESPGCPLLPITVDIEHYSLYPSNWPDFTDLPHKLADPTNGITVTEEMLYPPPVTYKKNGNVDKTWGYPSYPPGGPIYEVPSPIIITSTLPYSITYMAPASGFTENIPGTHIDQARTGYLFMARENALSGNLGWLDWDGLPVSATDLKNSLEPPFGNFNKKYPQGVASLYETVIGEEGGIYDVSPLGTPLDGEGWHVCYYDPDLEDCNDRLDSGEWIPTSTGGMSAAEVRQHIQYYVDTGQHVAVLVYDDVWNPSSGGGAHSWYRVYKIIRARFLGYTWTGGPQGDRYIVFEYIGIADTCFGIVPDEDES